MATNQELPRSRATYNLTPCRRLLRPNRRWLKIADLESITKRFQNFFIAVLLSNNEIDSKKGFGLMYTIASVHLNWTLVLLPLHSLHINCELELHVVPRGCKSRHSSKNRPKVKPCVHGRSKVFASYVGRDRKTIISIWKAKRKYTAVALDYVLVVCFRRCKLWSVSCNPFCHV